MSFVDQICVLRNIARNEGKVVIDWAKLGHGKSLVGERKVDTDFPALGRVPRVVATDPGQFARKRGEKVA